VAGAAAQVLTVHHVVALAGLLGALAAAGAGYWWYRAGPISSAAVAARM
jgi:hypothetical protein